MCNCFILYIKFNTLVSSINAEIDNSDQIICHRVEDPSTCPELLQYSSKNDKSLTIVTCNICSINCNIDSFLVFVSRIEIPIDVMVLTECRTSEQRNPPIIPNYNMYHTKISLNQNDGVVVYVRNGLVVTSVDEPPFNDGNCLLVSINDYTLICSYRPPCFSNTNNYINSLDRVLKSIKTKNIILTGDININIISTNPDSNTNEYLNLIATYGLLQGINLPTRYNNCLDHFSIKTDRKWQTVVFDRLTDHSPILLFLSDAQVNKKNPALNKNKLDYNRIFEHLKIKSWDELYNFKDANIATEYLVNYLQCLLNQNTNRVVVANKKRPLKPWITPGIIKSIRKRDKLHKQAKRNVNNDELSKTYRIYRNICNNIIKYAKIQYYETEFNKNLKNSKETWRLIKEICRLNGTKTTNDNILNIKDNPVNSLNVVNNYFTGVGSSLAAKTKNKLKTNDILLAKSAKKENTPVESLALFFTDPIEVRNIINSLKSNSAPGWDQISTSFLKTFSPFLVEPICFICNLSFETGIFPNLFKKANVCPVYKSGDRLDPSNYRPISLLSSLSKIIEKVVNTRLMSYLEKKGRIVDNQYGFRQGKSTEDAVLRLTSLATSYLDKGEKCVGVFLDFKKAFDTVSLPILITRLENVGIRGYALAWFKDYLKDRQQCVKVGNHVSDSAVSNYGIPQGSTLGPSLFLLYINDLCSLNINQANIFAFADDTAILFHGKTWEQVNNLTEEGLACISCWLEDSLLTLNTSKCSYICFSITDATSPDPNYRITLHTYPCNRMDRRCCLDCAELTRVHSVKYLGVLIDYRLKWDVHITMLAKRVRKLIYAFKNIREVAQSRLLLRIYVALCESILSYCICAWGGAGKTIIMELERSQRAVLKVLMRLPFRFPTSELYKVTKVLSVRKLYFYNCIRRYHSKVVPSLPVQNKRVDRCPVPYTRTKFAQTQYDFLAPYLYNKYNAKYTAKNLNNYKIKTELKHWLDSFDYDGTEQLLEILG